MALSLQKFREIVFQVLFSFDFVSLPEESEEEEIIEFIMQQLSVTKKTMREAIAKQKLIREHLTEIDALITKFSLSYDFDRIAQVEKGVLRLAIYELCFEHSVPPRVVMSEAVRLSRKFGTAESSGFVNAVLDSIYKSQDPSISSEKEDELTPALSGS